MLDRNIKEQNTNLSCKIAENSNKILSQAQQFVAFEAKH